VQELKDDGSNRSKMMMIELINRITNVPPNFEPSDVGAEVACQYFMYIGVDFIFLRIANSLSTENMKTLKYLDNQGSDGSAGATIGVD